MPTRKLLYLIFLAARVSFVWDIFIFDEYVRSKPSTCFAILLIMMGIWGTSYYFSPQSSMTNTYALSDEEVEDEGIAMTHHGEYYTYGVDV